MCLCHSTYNYYHVFAAYIQKHILMSCIAADHYKIHIQLIGCELKAIIP